MVVRKDDPSKEKYGTLKENSFDASESRSGQSNRR